MIRPRIPVEKDYILKQTYTKPDCAWIDVGAGVPEQVWRNEGSNNGSSFRFPSIRGRLYIGL